jgi:hypothetical protein
MSVSSTEFFSATNRISPSPIDHTRGRASMVDGSIIYSPNCGRTVKMPPMLPDINIELMLNTGRIAETHVDNLHQPLWWSQETAFLAFLPINPEFAGVPFAEFNAELVPKKFRKQNAIERPRSYTRVSPYTERANLGGGSTILRKISTRWTTYV